MLKRLPTRKYNFRLKKAKGPFLIEKRAFRFQKISWNQPLIIISATSRPVASAPFSDG